MISRQIGKIIRGNATPFQLFSACVLGSMLAFLPGFGQAPGAILILIFALIVLNANLTLAVLVGTVAKIAAIVLTPASFAVGRILLDGPTSGLFQSAINAPVLALCGFEYYTVSGGLFIGALFGIVAGFGIGRILVALRKTMASLEECSELFKKISGSRTTRLISWIVLGPDAKKGSWNDVMQKKVGLPVRPLGIVFVAIACALLFLVVQFGKGPIMTAALQAGLEKANGATVDIGNAQIDFKENKLTITGLAIADASNLDFDLLRAATVEADISTASLLSKRMKLDRVVISNAEHNVKRDTLAYRIGPPPEVSPAPPTTDEGEGKTIDDYLKNAKIWKERLAKAKELLDKISGPKDEEGKAQAPAPENKEAFEDWLKGQINVSGYNSVRAEHLLTGTPRFMIGELIIDQLKTPMLPDKTIDFMARNLSTHPWLVSEEKSIVIRSSKNTVGFNLQLGSGGAANSSNAFEFHYRGLPTDQITGSLNLGGEQLLGGGTMDIVAKGSWKHDKGVVIDLPLSVQLNNATISLPGNAGKHPIDSLTIAVGIAGPLDNPRIRVDSKAFAEAVKQAALATGTQFIRDRAGKELEKVLGDKIKLPGRAGGLFNKILGGKK